MTSLLLPSRRGFLGVLAGALAAPLVVRAESIMPVRWVDMASKGPLTAAQIVREANRVLREVMATRDIGPMSKLLTLSAPKQSGVDMMYVPGERDLPMSLYSDSYIRPAMKLLVSTLGVGVKIAGDGLAIPPGVREAAHCSDGNIQVRLVQDYHIGADAFVQRFDIRHT